MVEKESFYQPKRALVIVAHADDIEFGVSGTVARWTQGGTQVSYCIVTDSSSGDNRPGTDLEELKVIRKGEQIAAAAAVGVTDVRFLEGYVDGVLEPTLALRKDLTRIIRQVKPNVVVTFDPEVVVANNRDYINHPDHRAVGTAATYAVFPSAGSRPIFRDLLDEGLEPHEVDQLYYMLTNMPDTLVEISSVIDQKRAALACHLSQYGEDVIEMVLGWNYDAGAAVKMGAAESFRVVRLKEEESAEDRFME